MWARLPLWYARVGGPAARVHTEQMSATSRSEQQRELLGSIAAAALLAQLFAAYLVVVAIAVPPTDANWARADPILRIFSRLLSQWGVVVLGVVVFLVWWRLAPPTGQQLRRGLRHALFGVAVAGLVAGVLRVVSGPSLPSFIPAEESAGPGFTLGMTAGYAEEVLFRLMLLPALLFVFQRRLTTPAATAAAAVLTGLCFALFHEAGPGAFDAGYFTTRLLFPGAVMSVAFVVISPSFLVSAHCAAHVVIPLLFR